jgi:excisionase family DNA binding protein
MDKSQYYTTKETSDFLGVSRPTLFSLIKRGRIKAYRFDIGKDNFYLKSEVSALAVELRTPREVSPKNSVAA